MYNVYFLVWQTFLTNIHNKKNQQFYEMFSFKAATIFVTLTRCSSVKIVIQIEEMEGQNTEVNLWRRNAREEQTGSL